MITVAQLEMVWSATLPAEREAWMANVVARQHEIAAEDLPAWSEFLAGKRGALA